MLKKISATSETRRIRGIKEKVSYFVGESGVWRYLFRKKEKKGLARGVKPFHRGRKKLLSKGRIIDHNTRIDY